MEQCGECHSLAFRHGHGAAVHSVLKVQGDANWAWRRDVSPRQAESEVLGRSKGGAKVVVGEFEDFPAGVNKEIADALENKLSVISGPEPGVSVTVTVTEVGRQILSALPGPGSDVPVSDAENGAAHAW